LAQVWLFVLGLHTFSVGLSCVIVMYERYVREFEPLSEHKKRSLAVTNLCFVTFCLVVAWIIPMATRDWHVKRWYGALGAAGRVQLSFGLLDYEVQVSCNVFASLCDKLENDMGVRSYFDLTDRLCNVQQQFSSLIFRGCESLNLLTYLSLTTFTMLAVALWCFVIGAGLVLLYHNGYASKKLYNWIIGVYAMAPFLQACAVTIYVSATWNLGQFMDFGTIDSYRFVKAVYGSARVASFSMGAVAAVCLCIASFVPILILTQCMGRDKALWLDAEQEALLAEYALYEEALQGGAVSQAGYQPELAPQPLPERY